MWSTEELSADERWERRDAKGGGRLVKPTTETAQSFTHLLPRNWGKQVRGMVCVLLLRLS